MNKQFESYNCRFFNVQGHVTQKVRQI